MCSIVFFRTKSNCLEFVPSYGEHLEQEVDAKEEDINVGLFEG